VKGGVPGPPPNDGGTLERVHDIGESLRAKGMRMTPQRQRILAAVSALGHATPDAIAETVSADGGPALPPSTVYRNLEALEELGIVSHTHLDHRSPTWHLADHADHLHLVCMGCGSVTESDVSLADAFAGNLLAAHGFDPDVRHMAIHGWCAACSSRRQQ